MTSPEPPKPTPASTPMSGKKAGAVLIVLILIIAGIAYFVWGMMEQYAKQNRALEAGCTLQGVTIQGLATTILCPAGVEIK
jgi:uncharacterized protein HemX